MDWRSVWRWLTGGGQPARWRVSREELERIGRRREGLRGRGDGELARLAREGARERADVFALTCEAARRTLGLDPFDVQVVAGLAMAGGHVVEMQTGEGKTLAATLPACAAALAGQRVHVLTANDYLARRDAEWMGPIYRMLGLSVGWLEQGLERRTRQEAYACDVTYGSASEVGFDYLRDHVRRRPEDLVQRDHGLAIVDEADSVLIDEARIPLVIATRDAAPERLAREADALARELAPQTDFECLDAGRRVVLTEAGSARVEALLGCGNLFDAGNHALLAGLTQALHAHALLERDIDYLVKDGRVVLIDEYKGRLARLRRWPEGLQAAVEAKEGVEVRHAGRVIGSITVQSLVGTYERVCGMTGTAQRQAQELHELYGLEVVVVPTRRPVIRRDRTDVILPDQAHKQQAVLRAIREAHARGRPVLVGTASVADSEKLGALLEGEGIAFRLLNARNEEAEAAIIRQAGRPGAVTISTNMAGRGTDILLGGDPASDPERVRDLGGLLVIGTSRHESRRVDNQLRGRAGRQGDPGESRFFLSPDDELFRTFGLDAGADVDHAQRIIEGQHLEIRQHLRRYEQLLDQQRRIVYAERRSVLFGEAESLLRRELPERHEELRARLGEAGLRELERDVTLQCIDRSWSDYLEEVALLKEDAAWVSLSRVPLHEYHLSLDRMFSRLWEVIEGRVVDLLRAGDPVACGAGASGTGATWTYQTSDQAFPDAMARVAQSLRRLLRGAG